MRSGSRNSGPDSQRTERDGSGYHMAPSPPLISSLHDPDHMRTGMRHVATPIFQDHIGEKS